MSDTSSEDLEGNSEFLNRLFALEEYIRMDNGNLNWEELDRYLRRTLPPDEVNDNVSENDSDSERDSDEELSEEIIRRERRRDRRRRRQARQQIDYEA